MVKNYNSSWYFLSGWWTDAGTLTSYHVANEFITNEEK
jgi:dTDP-glucose pyrophosphorylase